MYPLLRYYLETEAEECAFLKPKCVFLRGILSTLSSIYSKAFWQNFLQRTELNWNEMNFYHLTNSKNSNSILLGMIYSKRKVSRLKFALVFFNSSFTCYFHSISVYECASKKITKFQRIPFFAKLRLWKNCFWIDFRMIFGLPFNEFSKSNMGGLIHTTIYLFKSSLF